MNNQREKEESSDCFIFCEHHKEDGIKVLEEQGINGLN